MNFFREYLSIRDISKSIYRTLNSECTSKIGNAWGLLFLLSHHPFNSGTPTLDKEGIPLTHMESY